MLGGLLAILCAGLLWVALIASGQLAERSPLPRILIAGYALRLVLQSFLRELPFFSHGGGGDCIQYEQTAQVIAELWLRHGIHYVNSDELPILGPTTLPPNLFALVIYVNGGASTRLGCSAIVALAAALAVLNIYRLAIEFGAKPKNALLVATIIYFQPAFLFYTCDTYKDGLVLCLALGALGSALRITFRFSLLHVVIGILCVWGLWYVRFYLIFVTLAPLAVGLVGIGSKGITRPLLATVFLGVGLVGVAAFSDILQLASDRASETFDAATSTMMMEGNRVGGSGVEFDDGGSPYAALPLKLVYTLFAPFLWGTGSIGFHLGKIDVIAWYFLAYRAVKAGRKADRRFVLMLATFVVPCTLMYAMTMANVGLIVRQRLIVVVATAILAALYEPQRAGSAQAAKPAKRARPIIPPRAAA